MILFSDIVYEIYETSLSPENLPNVLSRIGALFDAEGAVVIFYNGTSPADFIFSSELDGAVRVYLEEEWWKRDIHAQRALSSHLTSGDVFSDYTIATQHEIDSLPIYVDFFRRVGFGWLMSSVMLPDLGMLVALSVPRAKHKGPFSAEEMKTLGALGRHVEQALRISLRIANLEAAQTVLFTALDAIDAGIYALDRDDRLVFQNKVGQAQFCDHFAVINGRMTARVAQSRAGFAEFLAAASRPARAESPPRPCVLTGADGRRVVVWALPVTESGQGRLGLTGEARTLVLVMPVERDQNVDPVVLRDIFDLSLGEARLASLIGGGMHLRAAADRLGVTEGTARVVLKRVFRKLSVNRQAELVLQVSALGGLAIARDDGSSES